MEIEVEEEVYALSLWWEIKPVVKRKYTEADDRRKNKVRGDMNSCTEKRVGKELVGTRLEMLNLPDDVRYLQENESGLEPGNLIHGPVFREWAFTDGQVVWSSSYGPIAPQEKAGLLDCFISRNGLSSKKSLVSWESEELRREQMRACFSVTDRALEEEAQRYELIFHSKGKRVLGIPLLLSSHSDQAPEGKSFDRSGGIEEESWGDKST